MEIQKHHWAVDSNVFIVSDQGFSFDQVISIKDKEFNEDFGIGFHAKIRAIVENCFGLQGFNSWVNFILIN